MVPFFWTYGKYNRVGVKKFIHRIWGNRPQSANYSRVRYDLIGKEIRVFADEPAGRFPQDKKDIQQKDQYKDSMKYILESYSRILKEHRSIIMAARLERGVEDIADG